MTFTSYAQNFEDVMLWRALKHVEKGFYIDIGAQDPVVDSVTLGFYERGWCGINIEPTPHYASLLRDQRKGDQVLQAAVSKKTGVMRFFEIPNTGISTGRKKIAEEHRERGFPVTEITVATVTLASIFDVVDAPDVHWLKIDVEGMEADVLKSWRPSKLRPWIVVIESTLPFTQIESHADWEGIIIKLGYQLAYFDGLNRFYISNDHPELVRAFVTGPNLFDDFNLNGTASSSFCYLLNERHTNAVQAIQNELNTSRDALAIEQTRLQVEHNGRVQGMFEDNEALHTKIAQFEERLFNVIEQKRLIESQLITAEASLTEVRAEIFNLQEKSSAAIECELQKFTNVNAELQTCLIQIAQLETKFNASREALIQQANSAKSVEALLTSQLQIEQQRSSALSIELLQLRNDAQAFQYSLDQSHKLHASEVNKLEILVTSLQTQLEIAQREALAHISTIQERDKVHVEKLETIFTAWRTAEVELAVRSEQSLLRALDQAEGRYRCNVRRLEAKLSEMNGLLEIEQQKSECNVQEAIRSIESMRMSLDLTHRALALSEKSRTDYEQFDLVCAHSLATLLTKLMHSSAASHYIKEANTKRITALIELSKVAEAKHSLKEQYK
jgi:FkbM family methyltransferase